MNENPPFPWDKITDTISLPVDVESEIAELISVGDQVRAIKKVMELTGAGLKVSKDYVDSLKEQKEEDPDNHPMDSIEEDVDIQAILKALELNDGTFPRNALKDAVRYQEQIIPELLRIIEQTKENAEELLTQKDYMAHLYALFLLAQFREKRAYPLIIDFFLLPREITRTLTGDTATENLGQILASVSCGDISLLTRLVENENADEYIRNAALEGLLTLVICGEKSRDEIMIYFKDLFQGKLERKFSHVWNGLVACCVRMYPEEVMDEIKRAYEEDLVDPFFVSFEDVEKALSSGQEKTLNDLVERDRFKLITDTISEMEWWSCFNQERKHRRRRSKKIQKTVSGNIPVVNKEEKPGRNDPCWCGSGKKYKKCHLDADRVASN